VEVGVASTKAFTCQLTVLALMALKAGLDRGGSTRAAAAPASVAARLPGLMNHALALSDPIAKVAEELAEAQDILFLGRGAMYPLALEGALKLKEISYIHAEGYASGELKHGPIALIDAAVPVIVLAPKDALVRQDRVEHAGGDGPHGKVLLISDAAGDRRGGAGHLEDADPARSPRLGADPLCRPGAASGLSHRHRQGHGCGPAAQSGEIGDGGI
jgi:glutamine---fructose-6-phosphate transaminase (isomerizing)